MTTKTNSEQSTLLVSDSPFLEEVVRQIRSYDQYGVYKSWTNELVLGPYVISKKQKRDISLEGDIEPATKLRIICFYRAVASLIEKETAQLCQVIVDINNEGFGWALVWSGRLLTVCQTLRDAHRFGFDSLERLAAQGEKITQSGREVVQRFPEVARF